MPAGSTITILVLAAFALATTEVNTPPSRSANAAVVTRTAPGDGIGDHNGNGAVVRVGNGVNNRSLVAVGSPRNATGLQQATTGVAGTASTQGALCRRRPLLCTVSQKIRAATVEADSSGITHETVGRIRKKPIMVQE